MTVRWREAGHHDGSQSLADGVIRAFPPFSHQRSPVCSTGRVFENAVPRPVQCVSTTPFLDSVQIPEYMCQKRWPVKDSCLGSGLQVCLILQLLSSSKCLISGMINKQGFLKRQSWISH